MMRTSPEIAAIIDTDNEAVCAELEKVNAAAIAQLHASGAKRMPPIMECIESTDLHANPSSASGAIAKKKTLARDRAQPCARAAVLWGAMLAVAACSGGASAEVSKRRAAPAPWAIVGPEDLSTERGPVDLGRGAPTMRGSPSVTAAAMAAALQPLHVTGRFNATVGWPLIPIHTVLLPDGRVMSYGSDERGLQGAQFNYAVWEPPLGTGADAHLLLPNMTTLDVFCSGQVVLPRTGEVILTGGDRTVSGQRNYSLNAVSFFDYLNNKLRQGAQRMALPRWYPSVTTLVDGSVLVLGGRDAYPEATPAVGTPEVYDVSGVWRSLPGATNDAAYGSTPSWFYPRAWSAPDGLVFVAAHSGRTFRVNPVGSGSVSELSLVLPPGSPQLPSVMFAPGKILSIRSGALAGVIDLNSTTPTYTATTPVSQERRWANGTVLADGRVLLSGGSLTSNVANGVAYHIELWNPVTGIWTTGASATRMRLYHSTAMLLPDGRVLTAGGGAPGPVTNLNAEIYEPPYLFKTDGSGTYAARPLIESTPLQVAWGQVFTVRTGGGVVSKVAFVKADSVTHSVNFDQRYLSLAFTRSGSTLTVQAPTSTALATPGNYLLFVFNDAAVPSVAKVVRLAAASDVFPNSVTVRAKARLAGGVGAAMEVHIDGTLIASTVVANTAFADLRFALPSVAPAGARLDIVYTNDARVDGVGRSLHVEAVTINRATVLPSDSGVVFDRGRGTAAFDGINVTAGRPDLRRNGALRFVAPGAATSTVTVRARADLADDVGPLLRIHVDGSLVGIVEVRNTSYQDHVLRLPVAIRAGARIDVVYGNDAVARGDRNLYVELILVNGATLRPTDPGVVVDIGSGAAAFDGVNIIPGQTSINLNAALRMFAPAITSG